MTSLRFQGYVKRLVRTGHRARGSDSFPDDHQQFMSTEASISFRVRCGLLRPTGSVAEMALPVLVGVGVVVLVAMMAVGELWI